MPKPNDSRYTLVRPKIHSVVPERSRAKFMCEGCRTQLTGDGAVYKVHAVVVSRKTGARTPTAQYVGQCCIRDYMDMGWFNNA